MFTAHRTRELTVNGMIYRTRSVDGWLRLTRTSDNQTEANLGDIGDDSENNFLRSIALSLPKELKEALNIFLNVSDRIVSDNLIDSFIDRFGLDTFREKLKHLLDNPSPYNAERLAEYLAVMVYDN